MCFIFINMVNYYIRLLKSDGLLSEALSTSKTLFNNDKNSWFGCIDALLQYLNVNTSYLLKSKLNVKKYLLSKLRIKYEAIWRPRLLKFLYSLLISFKKKFLSISNFGHCNKK
jgi:hypothetical protein